VSGVERAGASAVCEVSVDTDRRDVVSAAARAVVSGRGAGASAESAAVESSTAIEAGGAVL
jgi:hypothetical protein